MQSYRGFTLLELLITLIISTIIISIAAPSLRQLATLQSKVATTNQVIGIIRFARETAVHSSTDTIICPSNETLNCMKTWSGKMMVYKDFNKNGQYEPDQDVLLKLFSVPLGWTVNWRAFGNRKNIAFDPTGYTFNQNGTLELCPPQQTAKISILILNRIGRLRRDERKYIDSRCTK